MRAAQSQQEASASVCTAAAVCAAEMMTVSGEKCPQALFSAVDESERLSATQGIVTAPLTKAAPRSSGERVATGVTLTLKLPKMRCATGRKRVVSTAAVRIAHFDGSARAAAVASFGTAVSGSPTGHFDQPFRKRLHRQPHRRKARRLFGKGLEGTSTVAHVVFPGPFGDLPLSRFRPQSGRGSTECYNSLSQSARLLREHCKSAQSMLVLFRPCPMRPRRASILALFARLLRCPKTIEKKLDC